MRSIKTTSICLVLSLLIGCSKAEKTKNTDNNAGNNAILIPPAISDGPIEYSLIIVGGKVGFINKSGKVVIQPKYSDAKSFSEGLAAVEVTQANGEKLWGFINDKGEFVIKPQYVVVNSFANKLALVSIKDKLKNVYIDRRGNVAVSVKEDWGVTLPFTEGLAPVFVKGKWGFIDTTGKLVVEPKFDGVKNFSNGLALVTVGRGFDTLVGYIDSTGKLVVPFKYKTGTDFSNGRALVSPDASGQSKLIDKQGNTFKDGIKVFMACSDSQDGFSESLLPTRIDLPRQTGLFKLDGCGYIDDRGNVAIQPNVKFRKTEAFSEELALVETYDKWGFINKKGKIVIDPRFEEANSFKNGLAYVKVNAAEEGYINHSGQFVWKPVSF